MAYKNVVGARRASLRIIGSIQNKEEGKGESEKVALISGYKSKVETELNTICMDILGLLDSTLIKSAAGKAEPEGARPSPLSSLLRCSPTACSQAAPPQPRASPSPPPSSPPFLEIAPTHAAAQSSIRR